MLTIERLEEIILAFLLTQITDREWAEDMALEMAELIMEEIN